MSKTTTHTEQFVLLGEALEAMLDLELQLGLREVGLYKVQQLV